MNGIHQTTMTITTKNRGLPTILLSALTQGGALYALHHAVKYQHWPAQGGSLMIGLYTCAVLIPLTVQLVAEHTKRRVLWSSIAALTAMFFYFGWYFGDTFPGTFDATASQGFANSSGPGLLLFSLEVVVLWLLTLPFLQSRLALGRWRVEYSSLFAFAWRNKIMLFEAGVFTGLFWLLLALWQALFHMLQIDVFRELFQQPIFAYPATTLVFGIAIHLIGAIERFVSAVLEQLLNVLKWLAPVAGVLLALFTLALLIKLPGLVFLGHKAIGAAWLLWLIAIIVLFLNAAYRDGTIAQPYPRWVGQVLRFVTPLTVVIALTALYSLWVRQWHYGLTVERFWALVVGGAALLYAIGYSVSALSKGSWFARMSQVNVGVALALIATIAAALTPLASPYRLAADSQYRRILQNHWDVETSESRSPAGKGAFQYLRWETGRFGRERLEQLAKLDHHPNAEHIRQVASTVIQARNPWQLMPSTDPRSVLASLVTYPMGRALNADLAIAIERDMQKEPYAFVSMTDAKHPALGLYIDLNGDGVEEFVMFGCCSGVAYQHRKDGWSRIGNIRAVHIAETIAPGTIETEIRNQHVEAVAPDWKDLSIGGHTFRVEVAQPQ